MSSHASTMMPLVRNGVLVALAVFLSAGARAQSTVEVDQVPTERTITTQERVEADMESARLSLGPMRIIPMVVVENAGYDSNVFSRPDGQPKISDWTVTAGAGGRGLLPMGSKLYLLFTAVPTYIWYDKLTDRRTWGGDFSGSFLALGNRLSVEATGSLDRGTVVLNSETQATVIETESVGGGRLEVGLTHSLYFVGAGEVHQLRYGSQTIETNTPISAQVYDRTDSGALAGLRLRFSSGLDLSAGVQGTKSDFQESPELRNNETFAFLGGLHWDRSAFYVNLAGGYRKGRAVDSTFPDYATTVGSYFISWVVGGPFELQAYGHRRPVYSLVAADQLYIESRYAGALALHIGSRIGLRGYGEAGTNSYPFVVLDSGTKRVDDAVNYGGTLSILLFGKTVLRGDATRTTLRSPTAPDRKVLRVTTGLSFNGQLTRE
jgi:hypothetical protein